MFKQIFAKFEQPDALPEDLGDPSPDKQQHEKEINIDIKNLPPQKDVEFEFYYNWEKVDPIMSFYEIVYQQ